MTNSLQAAASALRSRADLSACIHDPSQAAGLSRYAEVGSRTIEIASLDAAGNRCVAQVTVPATPQFDDACSAFAAGTLLQSPSGLIAVEDLRPGDMLSTGPGPARRVVWIGMALFRLDAEQRQQQPLIQVVPDAFGEARPDRHLLLGPGARILQTPPHLRGTRPPGLATRAREFVDTVHVTEVTPPAPAMLYHLMLDRHATIRAAGLDCETYHPGPDIAHDMSREMLDRFLSLFPNVGRITDFGPLAHPRAPESANLSAAPG